MHWILEAEKAEVESESRMGCHLEQEERDNVRFLGPTHKESE